MSKLQVFNHTTETGTLKSVLVQSARGSFERPTTLPANWKRCRIAALFSLRGLANETAMPVMEKIEQNGLLLNTYQYGLTNGAGMPGTPSVKFIGFTGRLDTYANVILSYSWWSMASANDYPQGCINGCVANGNSISIRSDQTINGNMGMGTPTGQSSFSTGLLIELDVTTTNTLVAKANMFSDQSPKTNDEIRSKLATLLVNNPTGTSTVNTGWWNNTDAPCDCTTLFFRLPYLNNRLVVHGYEVIQLA